MPINSRNKGKTGELELMHIISDTYGYSVKRGYAFNGQPDLVGLPGIHIECKRQERLNLSAAMEQSKRDSEKMADGYPTVFHRKAREEWLVTMRLEDWMDMYGAWKLPFTE